MQETERVLQGLVSKGLVLRTDTGYILAAGAPRDYTAEAEEHGESEAIERAAPDTKRCPKCGQVKPLTEFYSPPWRCIPCVKDYNAARVAAKTKSNANARASVRNTYVRRAVQAAKLLHKARSAINAALEALDDARG